MQAACNLFSARESASHLFSFGKNTRMKKIGEFMSIPYLDLKPQYKALEKQIQERIQTVLNHGQFILGPEVAECEKALAEYIGSPHCLTAASGTDALVMALMALDIGPGDEVITTPFSFFATAEVISLVGATPVFVDIERESYNINAALIEKAITPKTKAIMPVSLYGQPADFTEINALAEKHHLTVIEDSAQSFGAEYKGKKSCNLSQVSGTSFFPAKPLGCYGDGGAVFTTDPGLHKKMGEIRVHGQESRYFHTRIGINGRLDTLQCAILLEKLKRYDWELERRNAIANRYTEALLPFRERIQPPVLKAGRGSVWAQYTVAIDNRDAFANSLKAKGVPTSVHYPMALHHQPVYKHLRDLYHLPEAERAAARVISLPLYPDMTQDIQGQIIEAVVGVLRA
jgi:UDP-2-acetamido-2-deoxy-ribo-hexuluronate aminotransferase